MVKNLPEMWETGVQSQGRENILEKETATHSSILAWRSPWTEEPGWLQFMGSQRVGHNLATKQQKHIQQTRTQSILCAKMRITYVKYSAVSGTCNVLDKCYMNVLFDFRKISQ